MADYLEIDWNSRQITIPDEIPCLGVYNDKDSNRVWFKCPVEYGDYKVADYGLHVNYTNTGISGQQYDGDIYDIDDAQVDGDEMTFSWLVGRRAYLEEGQTSFVVCCKIVDSDNNVVRELNTTITSLPVLEGLELDKAPDETYPSYLDAVIRKCEAAEAAAEAATKVNENALVGVNVNGTPAEVEDHIAELAISGTDGIFFSDCLSASHDAEKSFDCAGIESYYNGLTVLVHFYQPNHTENATLNINDLGAVPIVSGGEDDTEQYFWATETNILFSYYNDGFVPIASNNCGYIECTTEADYSEKQIDIEGLIIKSGTRLMVLFKYANTAENTVLYFNNMAEETGYKTFEIVGDTNWGAGDYVDFVFDGEKWIVR